MKPLSSLLVLLSSLVTTGAFGAAAPYGKDFVEDGARWQEEAPPSSRMSSQMLSTAAAAELIRALSEQLAEQEYEEGPYAMSLAETLDDLGRAHEAAGNLSLAQQNRARALHLIRVNDGLYSEAQRPVLQAMLQSLRKAGDYEALDQRYDYFFRLYGSGQPPWNEIRWDATMEYLRWQREALRRGLDRDPMDRLLSLHRLHEDLLEQISTDDELEEGHLKVDGGSAVKAQSTPRDFRRLADASYSQLKTLYLIEDIVQPQPLYRERVIGFSRSEDPRDFNLQQERLENLQRTLRGEGRRLLENLLAVTPVHERRARAVAKLALADWTQWHGAYREAGDLYESLWQELASHGLESLAKQWFSKPVPLPDNGVFWQSGLEEAEGPIPVRLSVSESGRATPDTATVAPRWQRSVGRLLRQIAATRYRPTIQDGRIVPAEGVSASYWLY
ncbi:hypothetical protein [Congregibacter sp.]|uniref:hypothetical protein n=1 Tax=Congregibacter sp. TaxID=2744308 RepID=UPI003F6B7F4C